MEYYMSIGYINPHNLDLWVALFIKTDNQHYIDKWLYTYQSKYLLSMTYKK